MTCGDTFRVTPSRTASTPTWLAKLAIVDLDGLRPLELDAPDAAALDRRVRACDRLTREATLHKVRIKDLVRQLLPLTPLTGDIGAADLAVLERWADPHDLVKAGKVRLTRLIAAASHNHQGTTRAAEWLAAAHAALELDGEHPGVAFADLAANWLPKFDFSRPSKSNSPPTKKPGRSATDPSILQSWPAVCRGSRG